MSKFNKFNRKKLIGAFFAVITGISVALTAFAAPTDETGETADPITYETSEPDTSDTSDTSEPPVTSEPDPPTSEPDPPVTSDTSEPPVTSDTSEPPVTSDTSDVPDPPPPPPEPVIRLSFYERSLVIGEGVQLVATIENNIWENPVIQFTSFNTSVAHVDTNGNIIAVGEGDAYVTAYYGGIQADALIHVSKPAEVPEFLVLTQNTFTLKIGATAQIEAKLLPEDVSEGYTITYESNNPEIATVNERGLITALKTGEAAITVRGADLSETVSVTVTSDVAYDTAKLDGYIYNSEGNPVVGAQLVIDTLKAVSDTRGYFSFESVEQRELTIAVAGEKKTVCKLTPQGDTTVYLLYKKNSPLTRLGSYEELVGHLAVNKVTFTTGANVIMTAGETFELAYQHAPKDAPVTEIQYTTSNEITAEVGQIDGVITAKAPGETDITVSLNGGQAQAVCHVVVNPRESSEHSVLIVIIETVVIAAAVLIFIMVYRSYKKKLTRTLDEYEEEDESSYDDDDDE